MRANHPLRRVSAASLLASVLLLPVAAVAARLDVPDPFAVPAPTWQARPTPGQTGPNAAAPSPADLLSKARAGDVDAQVKLGDAYATAKPPNFQEALKWFRQASDLGSAVGAIDLAQMYEAGAGVAKNPTEAVTWLRLAAERGSGPGQASLGKHYENGIGVPQNYAEALKWYRAAADQSNAVGQNGLGGMYALGRGVAADQVEATRLFHLAANQGLALAQANLGLQYVGGRGTQQNSRAAYFWLDLAFARLPATSAVRVQVTRARDTAAAKLAPSDLEHVQQMASAWQPGSTDVPADSPAGPDAWH